MTQDTLSHQQIRDYYGRVLAGSKDLQTSACCTADAMAPYLRDIAGEIAPEVIERFYGCGSPIPPALFGATVLDLGCGTGRDSFLCAKLVGQTGQVIGVDMTAEQLAVGQRHLAAQMSRFGYDRPNVSFRQGYIEDLAALDIADNSVDVVISNCVINLSPAKERVFSEILRVLKPGGELYFSDVFADRRLPSAWREDAVLLGECLAGAMYIEDFRRLLLRLGVPDYRVVSQSPIALLNPAIVEKVGAVKFSSLTVRAFKLASLEDRCEDFGQVAVYRGTAPHHPHLFQLDDHHLFETGRPMLVCGNTAAMVEETRYGAHFQVHGERRTHYGLFGCAPPATTTAPGVMAGACC
jgi:SAM-dependent methyltransferase